MLKKRKRRKVNRRHTEPGLGASSGVAGDASSGAVVPAILPVTTTVAETGSSLTAATTTTTVPSVSPLPSMVNSSSGNSSGGGGKSRRALTALRSEAAIGASQFILHSQVRPSTCFTNLAGWLAYTKLAHRWQFPRIVGQWHRHPTCYMISPSRTDSLTVAVDPSWHPYLPITVTRMELPLPWPLTLPLLPLLLHPTSFSIPPCLRISFADRKRVLSLGLLFGARFFFLCDLGYSNAFDSGGVGLMIVEWSEVLIFFQILMKRWLQRAPCWCRWNVWR